MSQEGSHSAISILRKLEQEADAAHSYYFGSRVGTHLATAYFRAGERAQALAALRKVLDVGIQGGLYQTILDQGPEIGTLLLSVREQMARTGDPTDFVSYVDRLGEGYRARHGPHVEASPTSAIAKPLSIRESEILDLIARGRSNKEIARILSIAPETVKSHVKHIFIKLDVERRAQAVWRAGPLASSALYNSCYLRSTPCPVGLGQSQASCYLH